MKTLSARQLSITFIPPVSMLAAVAAVSAIYDIQTARLTGDMATIAMIHPLSGVLSSLGILLWCATAAICLFSALALRRVHTRRIFWFLICSALLSLYLLFDDLFLFHEDLAYRYLKLDQRVVYILLALVTSGYLIAFGRLILGTNYSLLVLALALLAISVVLDTISAQWTSRLDHWQHFLEDGAKWLGIASWCSYFVQTSYRFFVTSLPSAMPSERRDSTK